MFPNSLRRVFCYFQMAYLIAPTYNIYLLRSVKYLQVYTRQQQLQDWQGNVGLTRNRSGYVL
jgi:hypothetical protein